MTSSYLGEYKVRTESFPRLAAEIKYLHTKPFKALTNRQQFKHVNKTLLKLIQETHAPCFLLPAVLEYIACVNNEKVLSETYRYANFEFWLNHFSHLDEEENLIVRGKIAGRYIPRDEYQSFFPIGMNKYFPGSHFVAAHASPDVDTMVASFWGWVDAFSAKVSQTIHIWSLPGAFQDAHVKLLFQELFSQSVFDQIARSNDSLTLTAMDILSTKDIVKVESSTQTSHIDHTNHVNKAIVLIDESECYVGDWRASDAEHVRHVVMLFNSIIRWFESSIHFQLITAFSSEKLHKGGVKKALQPIFDTEIRLCEPVKEFSDKQRRHLNEYLKKILNIHKGIHATFKELGDALDLVTESEFKTFRTTLEHFNESELFDKTGVLIEDRPKIFKRIKKVFAGLEETISAINSYTDRLHVMHDVKTKVLGLSSQYIMLKSDIDEIKSKIDDLGYLTVVVPEGDQKWFPVGIVHASELKKSVLGTVSLRDFSNESETQMASYLEVISIIDHHKTNISTSSAPLFLVADAQSSNTIVASKNLELNAKYGSLGLSDEEIDKEIEKVKHKADLEDVAQLKRLQQLAQLKMCVKLSDKYFVDPRREFTEYLCYIYAILDDTDLLSKVSTLDVEVIAKILNRMKSITCKNEVEILSFDDIPRDSWFAKKAAKRILQNQDMYSIYKKIYAFKEKDVASNLTACVAGLPSNIFADTKVQNGCCRVGQTKLFQPNFELYAAHVSALRSLWLQKAKETFNLRIQIDFHMHMISTIPGADEVFKGSAQDWTHTWHHLDEIWIWVPPTQQAMERLVYFLNAFNSTSYVQNIDMRVEFFGENWQELREAFMQNFPVATMSPVTDHPMQGLPISILYFKPGTLNSRKAQITPYLPRLVS